jgi:hypothetical protein
MKLAAILVLSSLILTGCADDGSECLYFDRNIAREDAVLYRLYETAQVRELTEEEIAERAIAASNLTDLYMRADEVGCPHNG